MRGVRRVSKRKFQLLFRRSRREERKRLMSTKETTSSSHDIEFTERESGIFDIVRDATKCSSKKIVARVAGGWVRDKILGRPSDDIDIAVDSMSGFEFATLLDEYLKKKPESKKGSSKVTRIKANPDQSKHLETATMKIMGRDIDFVHLRTEEYTDSSRIPIIKVGTAREDAYRRDLTINALFYNINEDIVEDFTGKGLEDLREGTIRTPLEPLMTFLDDPLRVLRSLRFMHRYDFTMTKETRDACMNKSVHVALRDKVSPERVGIEMKKMLRGPNALTAMRHVFELNLHRVVFKFPMSSENVVGMDDALVDERIWNHSLRNIDRLVELRGMISTILSDVDFCTSTSRSNERRVAHTHTHTQNIKGTNETSKDEDKKSNALFSQWQCLVLGAMMKPFHDLKYQSRSSKKANWNTHPVSQHILLNSLKWPKKVANDLRILTEEAAILKDIMKADTFDVSRTGMSLRRVKDLWPVALCLALVDSNNDPSNVIQAVKFRNLILGNELPRIAAMRNPLNGKDLIKYCGVKPGPAVGEAMETLWNWLFLNPEATKQDCIEFLIRQ